MATADFGTFSLHYEEWGTGTPVLLVPGLSGIGGFFTPNVPAFSARHRVVVHDHRGTGRSSRSEIVYSVEQMTEDLVKLMDRLGIQRAHLVGHSTGGAIGQTLAALAPERLSSLVLFATWTKADPFFTRVFEARRALLDAPSMMTYIRSTPVFLYPDWWVNENAELIAQREATALQSAPTRTIAASRIDAIMAFDRTADLPKIKVPTLVICAKDDYLTPPYFSRALAAAIPGAELEILERGGHCASEVSAAAFNDRVLAFIERHDG